MVIAPIKALSGFFNSKYVILSSLFFFFNSFSNPVHEISILDDTFKSHVVCANNPDPFCRLWGIDLYKMRKGEGCHYGFPDGVCFQSLPETVEHSPTFLTDDTASWCVHVVTRVHAQSTVQRGGKAKIAIGQIKTIQKKKNRIECDGFGFGNL